MSTMMKSWYLPLFDLPETHNRDVDLALCADPRWLSLILKSMDVQPTGPSTNKLVMIQLDQSKPILKSEQIPINGRLQGVREGILARRNFSISDEGILQLGVHTLLLLDAYGHIWLYCGFWVNANILNLRIKSGQNIYCLCTWNVSPSTEHQCNLAPKLGIYLGS